MAAAETIKSYHASVETTPWGALPQANQLTFKIAVVAICHQFNWDFLQERLATYLLSNDLSEMIRKLSSARAEDLNEWLAGYDKPARIQATRRSAILRSVGKQLSIECGGDPLRLVAAAGHRIAGPDGFIAQLDRFESFRIDPLRKKSNVLVQDLVRERIVSFADEDALRPAVDYHVMRIYLRSGRVIPLYSVVAEVLKGKPRPRPRLVQLLRGAVSEAIQLTASYARLPVAAVNYVEWQLGRSICDSRRPACMQTERPSGLDEGIAKLFVGNCPYISFCQARGDPEWRKLREPKFKSTFY
jgi:hypothetical protein